MANSQSNNTTLRNLMFLDDDGKTVKDYVPPKNKQELQSQLELLFGLKVSDKAVCPEHSAPLDAIAASYFAETPVVVWVASRGFGGKTSLLAALSHLELLAGASVSLLGGSGEQSRRVHEATRYAWDYTPEINGERFISPFTRLIPNRPTATRAYTRYGKYIVTLTASQKSVRGLHPQRLRLDEVDEMRYDLYAASLGQTLDDEELGLLAQTTISSTHQYPDGTMTAVLKEAKEKGWGVFHWCYRESREANGGWLSDDQIHRKRSTISSLMWDTEYELQEPASQDRLFSPAQISTVFSVNAGRVVDFRDGVSYIFEYPVSGARYSTGADWAKDIDYTEIVTLRVDEIPARVVAYERVKGEPYSLLVKRFSSRLELYQGIGVHDSVGVGAAVADFIGYNNIIDYRGRSKPDLFFPLVMAIENGEVISPYIIPLRDQFRFLTRAVLFGKGHPPDGVVAMAMALHGSLNATANAGSGRMLEPIVLSEGAEDYYDPREGDPFAVGA